MPNLSGNWGGTEKNEWKCDVSSCFSGGKKLESMRNTRCKRESVLKEIAPTDGGWRASW
jgi:hypothetical protein